MTTGRPDILLVESDRGEEELALLVFGENDLGECVRVARTVEDALTVLLRDDGSFTPHIILLGLTPGGQSELELVHRLRSEWRTRTIPIVVIAASAEEARRAEASGPGISSIIVRPVDFPKIVDAASAFSLWWRALACARTSP